jgi:hypothetical protein
MAMLAVRVPQGGRPTGGATMKNEGKTTSMIEMQTRRIPSLAFLGAALGSMALSAGLLMSGKKEWGTFIAQWTPAFLLIGTYNKIAKTFSAPYDEEQRLQHGGHAIPKPNDYAAPSYS